MGRAGVVLLQLPLLAAMAAFPSCAHCDEVPRRPAPTLAGDVCEQIAAVQPDPASTTGGVHYLVSNERRLDLFAPHVRRDDPGPGVHLGVGTDPNYFIAAWSRSSAIIIVDFDQAVVDLHALYVLFLQAAETPEAFVALWSNDDAIRARGLIALRYFEPSLRARMTGLYESTRADVTARIDIMKHKMRENEQSSWLHDEVQYRHLRLLALRHAIVAIRGDFVAPGAVAAASEILARHGLRVKTLYLSNIEQYFMYDDTWRDNVAGLPLADDATVLRTLPGKPAGFEYIVQAGDDFRERVASKRVHSVYAIRGLQKGEHLVAGEVFVVTASR